MSTKHHAGHSDAAPLAHSPTTFFAAALVRCSDLGLLGIIFIAPLVMGGRSAVGKLVFVGFAIVFAVSWLLRQCVVTDGRWRWTAGQWIVLAGLGLLVLQLTPLPEAAVGVLAPKTAELLPLWSTTGEGSAPGFGTWNRVTLNPTATRGAVVLLLAYGMLFLVVVQRARGLSDVERMLKWLALAAVGLGFLALVQYFAPNGKFLWLFDHPYRAADEVQASFENRNHFAHMMALGVGPLCACLWAAVRRGAQRRGLSARGDVGTSSLSGLAPIVFVLAIGLVLFAGFMSLSRGGALAMTAAMLVCVICFYAFGLVRDKRFAIGLAAGAVLLAVTIFACGYDRVTGRLDDLTSLSADELDRSGTRRELWAANWDAFLQSPWLGFGAGAHRNFYKLFFPESPDVEFTHAENGYLQIASETGLAGLTLLAASVGLCGWWFYRGVRHARSDRALAYLGAVAAGLAASLVHSTVDFVWYIPACMSWTVVLLALACRLSRLAEYPNGGGDARRLPRAVCLGMLGFAAILSFWMVRDRWGPALGEPYWNDYLRLSADLDQAQSLDDRAATVDASPTSDKTAADLLGEMSSNLRRYLAIDPAYDRAHIRLAAVDLRRFQQEQATAVNPMDLAQVRDAALASRFKSREALNQWLGRAVGPHRQLLDSALRHARQGLRLCPLEGEGYVLLANLCFLEGAAEEAKSVLIAQALRVRPHDGYVAMAAGKESAIIGDLAAAAGHWRRAYHSGTRHQYELVALLAGQTPASFLLTTFEPTVQQWAPFFAVYLNLQDRDELQPVCDFFLTKARQQPAAAPAALWHALGRGYQSTGQQQIAESCARQAVTMSPEDIGSRTLLATILLDEEKYSEAEQQLRWCLQRTSADGRLKELLEFAVKGKVAVVARPPAGVARSPSDVARSPDRDTNPTAGLK